MLLLPFSLEYVLKDTLLSHFDLAGFHRYPQAIQHLLRTYAKVFCIERAVADLESTNQRLSLLNMNLPTVLTIARRHAPVVMFI